MLIRFEEVRGLPSPFNGNDVAGLEEFFELESGLEFGGVGQSPGVEVIQSSCIFSASIVIFFHESVGGRRDIKCYAKSGGHAFDKLGLADPQVPLEGEDQRKATSEREMSAEDILRKRKSFFDRGRSIRGREGGDYKRSLTEDLRIIQGSVDNGTGRSVSELASV